MASQFPYKKVLMVGATSGIGEALAKTMIAQNIHVVAVGRRAEKLSAFEKTHEHPDLDFVFLNAGIQRGFDFSNPSSVDFDLMQTEFTTNYLSVIHLAMAFLPHLQECSKQAPTGIAFTTSGLSLVPLMRCANYCATKAALHQWILVFREQCRNAGYSDLRVVELLPPAVQTELHDQKHQPDIDNGRSIGMPLDEFTEAAWKGLSAGKEQVPVGQMSEGPYSQDGFETKRQMAFKGMNGLK